MRINRAIEKENRTKMKLLETTIQQSISLAKEGVDTKNAIAKTATGSSTIETAVNFDNLRMDVAGLRERMARAESPMQKIAELIVHIDDAILTLFDFVNEVTRRITHKTGESYEHLSLVIVRLNSIHRLCISIKYECGLDLKATSMFSSPLLAEMTRIVQEYLHGHSNEYAIAVRNYALIEEVVILANQIIQLIHMYSQ